MTALFRDVELPSHAQDRHAHERFLLDTYAERRAEAQPSFVSRLMGSVGFFR